MLRACVPHNSSYSSVWWLCACGVVLVQNREVAWNVRFIVNIYLINKWCIEDPEWIDGEWYYECYFSISFYHFESASIPGKAELFFWHPGFGRFNTSVIRLLLMDSEPLIVLLISPCTLTEYRCLATFGAVTLTLIWISSLSHMEGKHKRGL